MNPVRTRVAGTAAAAVLAVALVGLLAGFTRPAAPQTYPSVLAAGSGGAVRATLFCPDVRAGAGLSTQVVAGTTDPGAGSVTLAAESARGGSATTVLEAGQTAGTYAGSVTGPVTLRAQGALTAGVVGEQLSHAESGTERGWSEARCEPATAEQWFVGASTETGDAPVVTLANPADARAIATVTVLTPSGLVVAAVGDNIVVPPHGVLRLPLVQLAPGAAATAVHVETESGQVAAAVRDVRADGTTPLGTAWVPVGQPASLLTVSGVPGTVPGGTLGRHLYLADPNPMPATVQVTVTTQTGSFVPAGLDAVTVPAESVVAVSLDRGLGSSAAAVTVRSEAGDSGSPVPVVAGVLADAASATPGGDVHDVTYLGPAVPLRAAGLVPVVRLGASTASVLVLSAPQGAGAVVLTLRPRTGATRTVTVTVSAGRTVTSSLGPLGLTDGGSVTVTPRGGSGPVYAARLIEEQASAGPLLSAYQVTGAPLAADVPAVGPLPLGAH